MAVFRQVNRLSLGAFCVLKRVLFILTSVGNPRVILQLLRLCRAIIGDLGLVEGELAKLTAQRCRLMGLGEGFDSLRNDLSRSGSRDEEGKKDRKTRPK